MKLFDLPSSHKFGHVDEKPSAGTQSLNDELLIVHLSAKLRG